MAPADDIEVYPDYRPEPVRRIGTPEALRAVGDPTRVRILETMVQRQDPPWSVKDLAAALAVPQTRLYHHVEQLLAHDLIRAVERRVVSGIIETRYRVTALSLELDRRMFVGEDAPREIVHETLVAVFDTARDELEAALRAATGSEEPDERTLVSRGLTRLTPARAAELRARLRAIAQEFDDDPSSEAEPWGFVLAVYPMVTTPQPEPTDD